MPATPRFDKLAGDAQARVREVSAAEAKSLQASGALLIDVREADEFVAEHAADALHLSRGIIELKIEEAARDPGTPIVLYCGGGKRSALAAASLNDMGYTNVASLAGGFRAWKAGGYETSSEMPARQSS